LGLSSFASALNDGVSQNYKGTRVHPRITNCMVGVVQSKATREPDLLPGQWREQRLHAQRIFGDLRGGIERRAQDLVSEDLRLARDG